jgi:hypothetical protein
MSTSCLPLILKRGEASKRRRCILFDLPLFIDRQNVYENGLDIMMVLIDSSKYDVVSICGCIDTHD